MSTFCRFDTIKDYSRRNARKRLRVFDSNLRQENIASMKDVVKRVYSTVKKMPNWLLWGSAVLPILLIFAYIQAGCDLEVTASVFALIDPLRVMRSLAYSAFVSLLYGLPLLVAISEALRLIDVFDNADEARRAAGEGENESRKDNKKVFLWLSIGCAFITDVALTSLYPMLILLLILAGQIIFYIVMWAISEGKASKVKVLIRERNRMLMCATALTVLLVVPYYKLPLEEISLKDGSEIVGVVLSETSTGVVVLDKVNNVRIINVAEVRDETLCQDRRVRKLFSGRSVWSSNSGVELKRC